ncbi:capsid assembly scaffolding protein Gp46 family protein, partial [Mycobacteroides abscessus]|uniref:capsid assembly scaffolding protein Gp46 family protein n=1 Tax=Mycobacteroides abscessus TaxID=36809 RepID=UPI00105434B5
MDIQDKLKLKLQFFAGRMKQKEQEKQDAIEEAKKLAKMNKDQQEQYELEKVRKENDELRNKQARYEMRDIARKMLNERDIKANDEI